MKNILFAAAAALTLAGCAAPTAMAPQIATDDAKAEGDKQLEYALKLRMAEAARVEDVSFKLLSANVDLCPKKRGLLGVSVADADQFKPPLHDVAVRVFGAGDALRVSHVVPGSPAAAAGVQEHDELVSFDGAAVPTGAKAPTAFMATLAKAMDKQPSSVDLVVRRSGQTQTLTLKPRLSCGYQVELTQAEEINAYADGEHIYVTRGILRIANSDPELALVVAHELAHDARGHIKAERRNALLAGIGGATLDVLAAAGGVNTQGAFTKAAMQAGMHYHSPEFEAEADYVGMYFLARAGYPTDGVENFWRKMAAENPNSIYVKTDHPATAVRSLAIAATDKEITAKRADGEALVPNEKGK